MKIYLDARNITAHPAGVARYAQSLIPRLAEQLKDHHLIVIRHASNREPLKGISDQEHVSEHFSEADIGRLRDFVAGVGELRACFERFGKPDVYHNLFHVTPLGLHHLGPLSPGRTIITLHDLIWIDHARASQKDLARAVGMKLYASVAIPHTLKSADHVICISEPTAKRAAPWLKKTPHTIIPHGVEPQYFQAQPAPTWLPEAFASAPYLVAVGNDKPYKNLSVLLRAMAQPSCAKARAVFVGSCQGLLPQLRELGLERRVHLCGFLDEAQLLEVMAAARLFVFPSLVEGFGLPPLEAMALGVPSLVSDLEPMRSIVDQGAQLFNPHDPAALAATLSALWDDDLALSRLSAQGRARAKTFDWTKCAMNTLQTYDL